MKFVPTRAPDMRLAIVIKSFQPMINKIAVLDHAQGRIDLVVLRDQIVTGSLIRYRAIPAYHSMDGVADFVLEDIPFELARTDLLFFHHILEVCYYFIPLGAPVAEIFDLLLFLYSSDKQLWQEYSFKMVFMVRLLIEIGFYSVSLELEKKVMETLRYSPFNDTMHTIATTHEKTINRWLRRCIAEHPRGNIFKTVHFLTRE
jgi:hypothetical protein